MAKSELNHTMERSAISHWRLIKLINLQCTMPRPSARVSPIWMLGGHTPQLWLTHQGLVLSLIIMIQSLMMIMIRRRQQQELEYVHSVHQATAVALE